MMVQIIKDTLKFGTTASGNQFDTHFEWGGDSNIKMIFWKNVLSDDPQISQSDGDVVVASDVKGLRMQ